MMDIQMTNSLDESVVVLDDRLPEPETDVARVAWSAIRDYVRARYGLSEEVIQLLSDESLESGRFNEFLSYIDSVRAYADLVDSATSWLVADVLVALYDREKARLERLSGASVSESDVLESILNLVGPLYGISSVDTAYQYYHLARRFPADKRLPGKTFRFYLDAYRLERSALVRSGQIVGYGQHVLPASDIEEAKDPVLDIIQNSSSKRQLTERIMREVAGEDAYLMISDGSSHRILLAIDGETSVMDELFADLGAGVWTVSAFVRWFERMLSVGRFGDVDESGALPLTIAVGDIVLSFRVSMVRKAVRLELQSCVFGGEET